jgi:hypothetical protein
MAGMTKASYSYFFVDGWNYKSKMVYPLGNCYNYNQSTGLPISLGGCFGNSPKQKEEAFYLEDEGAAGLEAW